MQTYITMIKYAQEVRPNSWVLSGYMCLDDIDHKTQHEVSYRLHRS